MENKPQKKDYINNKELLRLVIEAKEKRVLTNELATALQLVCARYATKNNFSGYTYIEDMKAYAMMMIVRTWNSFDPTKSQNPFAFYTQCIKHSFTQYLNQEKRHANIRDMLLINHGMSPSFGFIDDSQSDHHHVEDEQDFYYHHDTAKHIEQTIKTNILTDNPINTDDDQTEEDDVSEMDDLSEDISDLDD